jgi:hypothetical protein
MLDLALWVPACYVNFRYIPIKHNLMFANCVVFIWTTFLSFACHDDKLLRQFDDYNPLLTEEEKQRSREMLEVAKVEAEAKAEAQAEAEAHAKAAAPATPPGTSHRE